MISLSRRFFRKERMRRMWLIHVSFGSVRAPASPFLEPIPDRRPFFFCSWITLALERLTPFLYRFLMTPLLISPLISRVVMAVEISVLKNGSMYIRLRPLFSTRAAILRCAERFIPRHLYPGFRRQPRRP